MACPNKVQNLLDFFDSGDNITLIMDRSFQLSTNFLSKQERQKSIVI